MTSLLSLMDAVQDGNVQEIAAASTRQHPGLFLLMTPRGSAHREAEVLSSLFFSLLLSSEGAEGLP